jgi:hypothetical protein
MLINLMNIKRRIRKLDKNIKDHQEKLAKMLKDLQAGRLSENTYNLSVDYFHSIIKDLEQQREKLTKV